ncbi:hypothetical protein [Streptomyces sp. NBC_00209]|uniref:hypothetical protein n=1 Tax=Streptomyces sp. NBC_00209 TaxID=2975682 RepID=UPI00325631D0
MPRSRSSGSRWPTPRAGTLKLTCPAPTITPGYYFELTLDGAWEELPAPTPHRTPAAAATDHALTVVRNITANYLATDTAAPTARINTVLGRPSDVPGLPVRLCWATAHLIAQPDARQAALTQQRLAHEQEQRRTEEQRRLSEARALRDTLMSDPSLALSYWFAAAPHTIDTDTLARLEDLFSTAAAYAPHGQWAPLARLLYTFADNLADDAKAHLIDTLATLTDRYGRPDITVAIRALHAPGPERT